jgi:hypothetical protein
MSTAAHELRIVWVLRKTLGRASNIAPQIDFVDRSRSPTDFNPLLALYKKLKRPSGNELQVLCASPGPYRTR